MSQKVLRALQEIQRCPRHADWRFRELCTLFRKLTRKFTKTFQEGDKTFKNVHGTLRLAHVTPKKVRGMIEVDYRTFMEIRGTSWEDKGGFGSFLGHLRN